MQAAQHEDRPGPSRGRRSEEEVRTRPVSEPATEKAGGRNGEEDRTSPEPEPEIKVSTILWKSSHCKLLAKVSLRYFEFFKEHFKFLVSATKAMEKTRLESCLTLDLHSTEQAEEMGLSQVGEMELSEGPSYSSPGTLDEQVEWVTTHWMALSLVGGQPRTVCLSFLTKESKQVPLTVQNELSHGGCVLKLRPPKVSVWNMVLKRVLTACDYTTTRTHIQEGKKEMID